MTFLGSPDQRLHIKIKIYMCFAPIESERFNHSTLCNRKFVGYRVINLIVLFDLRSWKCPFGSFGHYLYKMEDTSS